VLTGLFPMVASRRQSRNCLANLQGDSRPVEPLPQLPRIIEKIHNFHLSSSPGAPDLTLPLGSFTMSALSAGQSNTFNQTGAVPAGIAPGQYHVWVSVDPDNNIPKSNDNDNLLRAASQLTVTGTTAGIKPVTASP